MRSKQERERLLSVQEDIEYLQGTDGNTYEILKKETQYLQNGLRTVVCRLGSKLLRILDKESFLKILNDDNSTLDALRRYKYSKTQYFRARKVYGKLFKENIEYRHRLRLSLALKGNKNGSKDAPSIILDKDLLISLVSKGKSIYEIESIIGSTAFIIRSNLRYYNIEEAKPTRLKRLDGFPEDYLKIMEIMSEGITESAKNFHLDRQDFFEKLYRVYLNLLDMKYMIKGLSKSHSHYISTGDIGRNHISWIDNKCENLIANVLLSANIKHYRQFVVKGYLVDFLICREGEYNLAIEIDGERHSSCEVTIARDTKKESILKSLDIELIRFSTKEVEKDLQCVIKSIMKKL